jgi:hypothetical protein
VSEVVLPEIPTIETYPVDGDTGAITLQAGGLAGTSRLLAGQGQGVSALNTQLAPSWSGEAANGYQALSAKIAGAFGAAAREIEAAAALMSRYAAELERLQREASTAAQESQHWHQQIVGWTGKVTDAQTALTRAQTALTAAHGDYTRAMAEGPKGAAAAAAASAAIGSAQGEVRKATADLANARRQLTDAHEQFTRWQDRAHRIHGEAMTAGDELSLALLLITIVPPPLPGAPDYPALEPTPGILLNDDPGDDEPGGKGDGEPGGKGEDKGDPPKVVIRVGPDGKIVRPPSPETRAEKGDPREGLDKAGQRYQQEQGTKPKEPLWVAVMHLLSHLVPKPPPPPPPPV